MSNIRSNIRSNTSNTRSNIVKLCKLKNIVKCEILVTLKNTYKVKNVLRTPKDLLLAPWGSQYPSLKTPCPVPI